MLRLLRRIVALAVVAGLLHGCASTPRAQNVPVADVQHRIYFIYRGWHTSILIDAKTLAQQNPLLADHLRGEKFARIGWGDGDYFTGKSKTWGTAARALVVSKYSAIQLLTYTGDPFEEIPADTRVPLMISDEGLRNLGRYIVDSIALDEHGNPLSLPASEETAGEFFQATGHYSILSNCNTWSGQALHVAGLPVAGQLTAQGVFEQARAISRIQANAGLFK